MTNAPQTPGQSWRDRPESETAETQYGLQDELQTQIEQALDAQELELVEKLVAPLHSADLADLLERLHADDRRTVVGIIRPLLRIDAEVLTYLNEDIRPDVLEMLGPAELAPALAGLVCGFFWELWNVFSLAHWQYRVPKLQGWQLFAMPLPGYAGYLPFGMACIWALEWLWPRILFAGRS